MKRRSVTDDKVRERTIPKPELRRLQVSALVCANLLRSVLANSKAPSYWSASGLVDSLSASKGARP